MPSRRCSSAVQCGQEQAASAASLVSAACNVLLPTSCRNSRCMEQTASIIVALMAKGRWRYVITSCQHLAGAGA
nr:hypothetical protein SEVIR_6G255400v2 [Setaria viridis]